MIALALTRLHHFFAATSLSMKISEYILHINSPPRLLFLGRFVGGRHVARLGLSAFSYAQKNPAVCAQHVSVRRFIMAPPPTELRVMMKSQKSETLRQNTCLFIFYFRAISGVVRCSLPHDYPQIALLIQSHARSIDTFMPCEEKTLH